MLALLVDAHGANLDAADARGASALHKACQARQPAAASVLLEWYGVPADRADPSGTTPLHLAARGGDASLAELLTGPAGRADPGLRDGDGNQALHIAAACGHLGVVKVMVEKAGADLGEWMFFFSRGGLLDVVLDFLPTWYLVLSVCWTRDSRYLVFPVL